MHGSRRLLPGLEARLPRPRCTSHAAATLIERIGTRLSWVSHANHASAIGYASAFPPVLVPPRAGAITSRSVRWNVSHEGLGVNPRRRSVLKT
jgi:hypothetical protein